MFFQPRQVAFQVAIRHVERVIGEHRTQQVPETAVKPIGTGLRSALAAAHGRPGRVDEHAAVADQVMAEQAAKQRVVPSLCQLVVQAWVDQVDIGVFHQRPLFHVQQHLCGKGLAQPTVDFGDFLFVEIDAGGGGLLNILPARLLEALASTQGDALEMIAVVVEAGEDHPGDFDSGPGLGHAWGLGAGIEYRA